MVSPKQLDFSSSGGVGDSDAVTLSRLKSPRTPSSKRTAPPEVTEAEEEAKKKKQKMNDKKKKKKNKNKIWNEEDEVTILKRLVDFRAKTGLGTKIDWDEYYRFLGVSIVEKYSKDQVYSKIRKLRKKYLVQMEKITQRNDPNFTRCSDSEIFGYSEMIWGQSEAAMDKEMVKDNGAGTDNATARQEQRSENGEEVKENEEEAHDESLNDNEAVTGNATARQAQLSADHEPLNDNEAVTESGTARQGHQINSDEETRKEQEKEADVERLNENRAAKITETNDGKEGHGDNDEFFVVQDSFETLMSQSLSKYQKKVQLEKLLNIRTNKMRELSDEWKALCDEERSLNLKKLRYSTKLAEAVFQ